MLHLNPSTTCAGSPIHFLRASFDRLTVSRTDCAKTYEEALQEWEASARELDGRRLQVQTTINNLESKIGDVRLLTTVRDELAEARKELAEARKELAEAEKKLAEAEKKLAEAETRHPGEGTPILDLSAENSRVAIAHRLLRIATDGVEACNNRVIQLGAGVTSLQQRATELSLQNARDTPDIQTMQADLQNLRGELDGERKEKMKKNGRDREEHTHRDTHTHTYIHKRKTRVNESVLSN